MSKIKFYEAIATLIGMTIGAGILGIPYVIAQSGFLIGIITILVIAFMMLIVNLAIGEICLRTKGNHQLTGYAEKYLGKKGKVLMLTSLIIGFYGALIAYIIGEGETLSAIIPLKPFVLSAIFFIVMTAMLYFGLDTLSKSELVLSGIKMALLAIIATASFFVIKAENLITIDLSQIFIPYGVVLFAFMGSAAIPEMKEELFGEEKKLKKAIITGLAIITAVYILFALIFIGVNGKETTEVSTLGLAKVLGNKILILGSLFAMLTMATSYIAVGFALKETYNYDLKINKMYSWFLTSSIPILSYLILYVFDLMSFTNIIGISGAISGSLSFILIILMHQEAKKKGDRKPEFEIKITKLQASFIITFFILATIIYLTHFF
ncbi:MAG: aromatic amino acid transport family protein [Nanoarchaeota archaeon]|nr:aromatic amino acid transport family protein [Nanoarchaeota archaeon]